MPRLQACLKFVTNDVKQQLIRKRPTTREKGGRSYVEMGSG